MTLSAGDELPLFEFAGANAQRWRTDVHRTRGVPLVLILHRHLA